MDDIFDKSQDYNLYRFWDNVHEHAKILMNKLFTI